jgi:hypothetical protein
MLENFASFPRYRLTFIRPLLAWLAPKPVVR